MNWRLIFGLSVAGIAMGVASLFGLTGNAEPLIWLVIFAGSAWLIATRVGRRYFLHGFLVSVLNGLWITPIHVVFYETYIRNNPGMLAASPRLPPGLDPRVMMMVAGPLIGAVSGLIAGLFAVVAAKIVGKRRAATPA